RVVSNAVEVDYQVGYASVVQVTTTTGNAVLGTATFTSANVGQPISIPEAGVNGGTLNTVIRSVSSGAATVRDKPQVTLSTPVSALLVNFGSPAHWELLKSAI